MLENVQYIGPKSTEILVQSLCDYSNFLFMCVGTLEDAAILRNAELTSYSSRFHLEVSCL